MRAIELAAKEAKKSSQWFKMGCVIVRKNGKVIGRGYNKVKTHPSGSGFASSCHAEVSAVINALGNVHSLDNCIAYVYRKNGLMAKPCKDCHSLLKRNGIKKVYYTTEFGVKCERIY